MKSDEIGAPCFGRGDLPIPNLRITAEPRGDVRRFLHKLADFGVAEYLNGRARFVTVIVRSIRNVKETADRITAKLAEVGADAPVRTNQERPNAVDDNNQRRSRLLISSWFRCRYESNRDSTEYGAL